MILYINIISRHIKFLRYAHPIIYGDYPESMKSSVGARLPKFTKAESEGLRKSIDFLGVNYYTTYYAENAGPVTTNRTFYTDMLAALTSKYILQNYAYYIFLTWN